MKREGLHTVCEEAGCPNIYECWEDREATFLIGGDQCTRRCDFCQIDTGKPEPLDRDEPRRVAESVQAMGLRYATVTGVARDDLDDEGAWLYAETVAADPRSSTRAPASSCSIPDFNAVPELLAQVFDAAPEVLAHNVETVPRIFKRIRPGFRYERSLEVIRAGRARRAGHQVQPDPRAWARPQTRSSRRCATCTAPAATCSRSPSTCARARATTRSSAGSTPAEFDDARPPRPSRSASLGVMSGPLVRSSYRAGRLYQQRWRARRRPHASRAAEPTRGRAASTRPSSRPPGVVVRRAGPEVHDHRAPSTSRAPAAR